MAARREGVSIRIRFGEAAFQRATGIMGLPGTSILVFGGGRSVNVTITGEGDAAAQLAAAIVIAEAALAS